MKTFKEGADHCEYDSAILPDFSAEMFESKYWHDQSAITGTAVGRGTTWFIKSNQHELVLKHYYRGGFMGKLFNDGYFYLGNSKTRAGQEFNLLQRLMNLGLPVPRPVGYRNAVSGLVCRMDILTEKISNATDLVSLLREGNVSSDVWEEIGKTIRAFHDNNVFHADLNANNILIDSGNKVWLIDFDKGEIKTGNDSWKQGNLDRLHRSLVKEEGRQPSFHWKKDEQWGVLLGGYGK